MFTERTSVGLDVHARSVAAAAIDSQTGELLRAKLTASYERVQSGLPRVFRTLIFGPFMRRSCD